MKYNIKHNETSKQNKLILSCGLVIFLSLSGLTATNVVIKIQCFGIRRRTTTTSNQKWIYYVVYNHK